MPGVCLKIRSEKCPELYFYTCSTGDCLSQVSFYIKILHLVKVRGCVWVQEEVEEEDYSSVMMTFFMHSNQRKSSCTLAGISTPASSDYEFSEQRPAARVCEF